VVILNACAARDLFGSPAGNVRSPFFNTLEWLMDPILDRPAAQTFSGSNHPAAKSFDFHLHIRFTGPLTIADLRNVALSIDSRATVKDLRTVPDMVAEATRQPAFRMRLLFSFAGISLLLAAIGVTDWWLKPPLNESVRLQFASPSGPIRRISSRACYLEPESARAIQLRSLFLG
jgi:hypothetical protein